MQTEELNRLIQAVIGRKAEGQVIELKAANKGFLTLRSEKKCSNNKGVQDTAPMSGDGIFLLRGARKKRYGFGDE